MIHSYGAVLSIVLIHSRCTVLFSRMIHSLFIGALDSDDSLRGVGAVVVCGSFPFCGALKCNDSLRGVGTVVLYGSFNGCGALVHLDSFCARWFSRRP